MVFQQAKRQGSTDDGALTLAALQYTRFMREEAQEDDTGTYYGGASRRGIAMILRRSRRRFTR
jgi:hypothetical protein